MKWRDLTESEAATLPEAQLGGGLLCAVIIAAVLCLVALAGYTLAFRHFLGIGRLYVVAITFVTLLAFAFIVMTLLRFRHTPTVMSVGLVVWIVYRAAVGLYHGALTIWPLQIDGLGEGILAAGFCAYMASGVRPNAYYRRRLPVP